MPRKPEIDRPVRLETALPSTLRAKLDLLLFSPLEGRVPHGKYQEFIIARIVEFFASKRLDLEPFGYPQGYYITGPKEMVDEVEVRMKARTA